MLCSVTSLVTQMLKNLPAMPETWIESLGWEDPLKKGMAIHSSILAWRIPWTEEPDGLYTVHGVAESDTTEAITLCSKVGGIMPAPSSHLKVSTS